MTSIADSSVNIQTTPESNFSIPSWFGEVVVISKYLQKHGVLGKVTEHVRFARKRFGRYDVIDFLAVLFGYAISGERTLEAFYERLQPFASVFMALFDRDQLPSRSALSRFLAALSEALVAALRTLFLDDVLSRPLTPDKQTGSLLDRMGNAWVVFDIDGTREAARQRAWPQTDELPPPFRRLNDVCALATEDSNAGRLFALVRQFLRPITSSGSAVLATAGTGITEQNCARLLPQSRAISPLTTFPRLARCSGSTANTEPGPCSRISQASPL